MDLHETIKNDDLKSLQKLIKICQSVNSQSGDTKNTPLHIACRKGHTKAAEILIDAGADLHIQNKRGLLPIHLAITYNQPKIIDLLLSRDPTLFSKCDGNGNSLLHIAVSKRHLDIVDFLLQYEANVEATNKEGNTVYHMAVLSRRPHILKILLKHNGVGINKQNFKGHTPLHLAALKAYEECAQVLLMFGANPTKKDSMGKIAKDLTSEEKVKNLFSKYDLYKAIHSGCSHGMATIIARRKFDIDDSSALHIASLFSADRLLIQQLVPHSKVDRLDANKKTALYYAIQGGRLGPIHALLSSGAKLANLQSDQTPLHIAVQRQDYELTKLLLKFKANVNKEDKNGDTPLLYAVVNRSRKIVNVLIRCGADVCQTDRNGNTPLHLSVIANNIQMSELLIPHNQVIIDSKNKYGRSPLMCAILGRNLKLVRLLIESGSSIYTKDANEKTACMLAEATKDDAIIKLLKKFDGSSETMEKC